MKLLKLIGWGVVALIVIGVIGSQLGEDRSSTGNGGSPTAEAEPVTGVVSGTFRRNCLLCDERLREFISTGDVWCGWRDDRVVVHVTMTNDSVEHLTVNWHPSYVIAGGGEHGAGLTAIESSGFDAGETRELEAVQDPEGVTPGSGIKTCKPSFSTIESG